MILLSLDLELNEPNTKNRVIEIGYVIGDTETEEILTKKSILIRLPENEVLMPFITTLTGIEPDHLETNGVGLDDAFEILWADKEYYKPFINPLQWGHGDADLLCQAFRDNGINIADRTGGRGLFGRRVIDVKTLYVSHNIALGLHPSGGLSKSMAKVGLQFQGKKHRAHNDAYNTFFMYLQLIKYFKQIL